MNELFHYYAVRFLSLRSGFSPQDSRILAYSSQLLDRAIVPVTVIMDGGKEFIIPPTHHFGFWDKKQEAEIWTLPFTSSLPPRRRKACALMDEQIPSLFVPTRRRLRSCSLRHSSREISTGSELRFIAMLIVGRTRILSGETAVSTKLTPAPPCRPSVTHMSI